MTVKKGWGGLGLAMGDPALVGEVDASTVDLNGTPEASTRDEAWALGSILLSTKVLVLAALAVEASEGMATDLLVLVTLVGSTEHFAGKAAVVAAPTLVFKGSIGLCTGAIRVPAIMEVSIGAKLTVAVAPLGVGFG